MAAPNLKNPTTINGKTARAGITTTAIVGVCLLYTSDAADE